MILSAFRTMHHPDSHIVASVTRLDRLLNRTQGLVPQLVLRRHALERTLDLAIAPKILLAVDRMVHLLVELGLYAGH
jgi:RAB protein geranylgeranyltransferase component A